MRLRELLELRHLWKRSELLAKPCPIPREPGVYGWYIGALPSVPVAKCRRRGRRRMVYIGISPSKAGGKANLRTRLKQHLRGDASRSTLRMSLGCVIGEELGLRLVEKRRRFTFGAREAVLSDWMEEHARVVWVPHLEPWVAEAALLSSENLPLNLRGNEGHPFHGRLSELRRRARDAAVLTP